MQKNKERKLSLKETIKNDWYALKLGFSIKKSLVVHAFLTQAAGYFEWVFFDAIFLRYIVDALDKNQGFSYIFLFIVVSGAAFFLINLYTNYVENVVWPLGNTRLYYGIYSRLYAKAKNVELRCYEDADFYNRYTMAMDGAEEKVSRIINNIWGILAGTVATLAVFWFMYDIDHYAVLFILSPLLGNFVFGNYKNKYEFKRYQEQAPNDKVLNYVNRVMYLPDYAKEIRLSNVFALLKQQYHKATVDNVRVAIKYAFANASLNFLRITFTFTVIFEGVLLYAIYRNEVTGSISLAQLTVMTSLMVAMTWILIRLFENIMEIMKNGMFINNLRGFMEYEEKIPEDQDGVMPEAFESLEFDHVSFSYKEEETVKDLNFVINKGEIAALVGHNGAGKTTIIKLLLRLYDPTSGVIRLNGRDIREYNLHAYRELFATTFQDFRIFGMTVRENVLMGRHYENEELLVEEALKRAGVYDKVGSLPEGIHTMMTKEFEEEGAVLSGGESQKIAVARTFVKPAPVKIFDEPSSALDPIAEYELFQNIMREGKEHTMLFISHRLSSVRNCDKVFMLERGRLIEEGSHKELMERNGSYAKMYRRQAMNYLALEKEEEVAL
ncbi:MAG: ABC transporter ATP-binding protein/permease [Roseburia sp.]|nr:ABC transporter ATP-binding protein/permease [Roseburia sp.]